MFPFLQTGSGYVSLVAMKRDSGESEQKGRLTVKKVTSK
jgi:hypothetical protein